MSRRLLQPRGDPPQARRSQSASGGSGGTAPVAPAPAGRTPPCAATTVTLGRSLAVGCVGCGCASWLPCLPPLALASPVAHVAPLTVQRGHAYYAARRSCVASRRLSRR